MSLVTALVVVSFVAALVLLLEGHVRVLSGIALVTGGVELLLRMQVVSFSLRGVHWGVLGGALVATVGGLAWLRVHGKSGVTAATLLLCAGLLQIWLLK